MLLEYIREEAIQKKFEVKISISFPVLRGRLFLVQAPGLDAMGRDLFLAIAEKALLQIRVKLY